MMVIHADVACIKKEVDRVMKQTCTVPQRLPQDDKLMFASMLTNTARQAQWLKVQKA